MDEMWSTLCVKIEEIDLHIYKIMMKLSFSMKKSTVYSDAS